MSLFLDAFWRAVAYCLHPRVILWSVLPLLLAGGLVFGLGWFYWEVAVNAVAQQLQSWELLNSFMRWLDAVGVGGFRAVFAPMIVVALSLPVVVLVALLCVAVLMMPALVRLVAARRFPALERKRGASWWSSLVWSLGATLLALVVLVISLPFWLFPPVAVILPPLVWGWLAYRVMSFDALAEHASRDERRSVMREHRLPLLAMGVLSGCLGAAPSLVWAFGAMTLAFAPLLVPLSIWLYTLVFAFSGLWFIHYALGALAQLRAREGGPLRQGDMHAPAPSLSVVDPDLADILDAPPPGSPPLLR